MGGIRRQKGPWIECDKCRMWASRGTCNLLIDKDIVNKSFICDKCLRLERIELKLRDLERGKSDTRIEVNLSNDTFNNGNQGKKVETRGSKETVQISNERDDVITSEVKDILVKCLDNVVIKINEDQGTREVRNTSVKCPDNEDIKINEDQGTNEVKDTLVKCLDNVDKNNEDQGTNIISKEIKSERWKNGVKGVILGDSMVRNIGNMLGRENRNIARCCLPGARIADVNSCISKGVVEKGDSVILWVGTNDVTAETDIGYFEKSFWDLITKLKDKEVSKITVIGLMPRYRYGKINQKARICNLVIKQLCQIAEVRFVNVWKSCNKSWLGRDGIHLSRKGNYQVFMMLAEAFNSKN